MKEKKADETCHITIVEILCVGIIFLAVSKIYAFIYLFMLEVNVFDIIYRNLSILVEFAVIF